MSPSMWFGQSSRGNGYSQAMRWLRRRLANKETPRRRPNCISFDCPLKGTGSSPLFISYYIGFVLKVFTFPSLVVIDSRAGRITTIIAGEIKTVNFSISFFISFGTAQHSVFVSPVQFSRYALQAWREVDFARFEHHEGTL